MSKAVMHLDVETFALEDIREVGLENYARSTTLVVTVIAWAFDGGPVKSVRWPHSTTLPTEIEAHIHAGGEIHAWNAAFEWNILYKHFNAQVGLGQMSCTMQRAAAYGLPLGLYEAGVGLGLPVSHLKDKAQRKLMLSMSKPAKNGTMYHECEQQMLYDLEAYCQQDVVAERAIADKVPELTHWEKKIARLDGVMNERGVQVDLTAVSALRLTATWEENALNGEASALTNGVVSFPATQHIRIVKWLADECGVVLLGVSKEDVAGALAGALPPAARRMLEIRRLAAKASVAKLEAMRKLTGPDGRTRNHLQYYGASRTGRWAGRGVQVQNMPRGIKGLDVDQAIRVSQQAFGGIAELYDAPPLDVVSACLRGCLTASPGHVLVSCDLSQIEARVLAWLARQTDVLEAFTRGEDVYTIVAAKVGSTDRQLGKVLTLAAGYGMGAQKFQHTAQTQYGLALTIGGATLAVNNWRTASPKIVRLWNTMQVAVESALKHPGIKFRPSGCPGIVMRMEGSRLVIKKPSGSKLYYHGMRLWQGELLFEGEMQPSKAWGPCRTYGAKLVENIVQSVARDVMCEGMLAASGYGPLVMTVHDEAVWEMREDASDLTAPILKDCMVKGAAWTAGLPLGADLRVAFRYGK